MIDQVLSRELMIVAIAALIAIGGAANEVLMTSRVRPVWSIRVWLWLSRHSNSRRLRQYAETGRQFSRREQFVAAFFVWFFIIAAASLVMFGCGYRAGCQ